MRSAFRVLKKALGLLTEKEQKKLAGLAVVVVIMSFIELLGVVSILPFMAVATNPETIQTNTYLAWAYETFGFTSPNRFLVALGLLALTALIVGNLFRAFSSFLLLRFAHMQNHYLSKRVLETYLSMPYEYFLTRNSSDLTKDAITEVQQVVSGVYIPLLQGAGRVFLAFLIVILLIIIDPLLAIVVGSSVAGSYALIYKLFKSKITRMAKLRTSANQRRVRLVSEAGGG